MPSKPQKLKRGDPTRAIALLSSEDETTAQRQRRLIGACADRHGITVVEYLTLSKRDTTDLEEIARAFRDHECGWPLFDSVDSWGTDDATQFSAFQLIAWQYGARAGGAGDADSGLVHGQGRRYDPGCESGEDPTLGANPEIGARSR